MGLLKRLWGKEKAELTEANLGGSPHRPAAVPQSTRRDAPHKGDVKKEVEALLFKLNSPDAGLREESLTKMISLGPQAVQPLINHLRHPDRGARLMAATALGKMRDTRAISALGHAAKDQDPEVAAAAKASMKELLKERLGIETERTKQEKEEKLEKMRQEIKKSSTWTLLFDYLRYISHPDPRWADGQSLRAEELKARGITTMPVDTQNAEAVGEAWKELFVRSSDWNSSEMRESAEGLVKHFPADASARLIMERFAKVKSMENIAHVLALILAQTGFSEAGPFLRQWIENGRLRQNVAAEVARFIYGDVRPWAQDLGAKRDYAALAAIFNSRDYSAAFQLGSRRPAAREILVNAGQDAVPAIVEAMNRDEVGIYALAALLVGIGAREAIPELKRHLDAGRLASDPQINEKIFKFVYGERPLSSILSSIISEPGSEAEKREKIQGILRAAGWLSQGASVLYCECGYPTRIRYSDGSVGPINPALDDKSTELYVAEYSCPKCHKHVATVTS